jgi:hypothetical protein
MTPHGLVLYELGLLFTSPATQLLFQAPCSAVPHHAMSKPSSYRAKCACLAIVAATPRRSTGPDTVQDRRNEEAETCEFCKKPAALSTFLDMIRLARGTTLLQEIPLQQLAPKGLMTVKRFTLPFDECA